MQRCLLCLVIVVSLPLIGFAAEPSLTSNDLDKLMAKELGDSARGKPLSDELFLRRISLDLIGRPPTPTELDAFLKDASSDKRKKTIDRLLDSREFGTNWADYWSDTIKYRVPPPELTFLDYGPFKKWLADKLNNGTGWDVVVRDILTANGKIDAAPQGMFIAFHQARPENLAAESARVFLGLQLQCAQCHDHRFDVWKREQFHSLAAYFARTEAKLTQKSPFGTVIKDKGKGEYAMPDVKNPKNKGKVMQPVFLSGQKMATEADDATRRAELAKQLTAADNPWFARAYVNRIWARLMGRGFYEPVDNMSESATPKLVPVHEALAKSFTQSGFDSKSLFRTIANSAFYQRELPAQSGGKAFETATTVKLRGDELFRSLSQAIGLTNVTPPVQKATEAIRFPPPPKSTTDLVCDCYGYDPSQPLPEIVRTMPQAMMMMNNKQIQAQINADPASNTLLSKLLNTETDDVKAAAQVYRLVLGRNPTAKETSIVTEHLRTVGKRGEGFEDLMWSLINSAEFTTKR